MSAGTNSRNLLQKRILITDIENEFGKELQSALKGEGAVVFTFVKTCSQIQQVVNAYPDVIAILLDLNHKDAGDEGYKLLMNLPSLDHIINLSGDSGLDVISKAYGNWKIHNFGENKTKPLISKMKDAGLQGLIFHSSAGNYNLMSKLKANLNPRYTDSATAQVSTSVRKSFKKLFSNSSSSPVTQAPVTPSIYPSITESNTKANEFASVAKSLSQNLGANNGDKSPTGSTEKEVEKDGDTLPKRTITLSLKLKEPNAPSDGVKNSRVQTLAEKNERIRQSAAKMNKKAYKKWNKMIKNIEKDQIRQLKSLEKNITRMKKKEKGALMSQNAEANASTASRSDVLSAETANRIMASREARVDREIEKKADKQLDEGTKKIAEDKTVQMEAKTEKLYHKMIAKQIAEFSKIKTKYLI